MKFRLDDAACDNLRSMLGTDDEPTRVVLFVGELQDEDGTPIYGLHAYEAEYPEEGAVTLAECPPPASGVPETPEARRERLIANGYKTDSRCTWLAIGKCAACGCVHDGAAGVKGPDHG